MRRHIHIHIAKRAHHAFCVHTTLEKICNILSLKYIYSIKLMI